MTQGHFWNDLVLKPSQNKKGRKNFQLHRFLNTFSQLLAVKKYSKNGAAGNVFGPSYFDPALEDFWWVKPRSTLNMLVIRNSSKKWPIYLGYSLGETVNKISAKYQDWNLILWMATQFYIQLLYRPHFGPCLLPFVLLGSKREISAKVSNFLRWFYQLFEAKNFFLIFLKTF